MAKSFPAFLRLCYSDLLDIPEFYNLRHIHFMQINHIVNNVYLHDNQMIINIVSTSLQNPNYKI